MPEAIAGREPPNRALRDPRPVLAFFYVAMFGHLGIVLPFLAPWLRDRGHDTMAIGLLVALPPLFKVLTPWNWAGWADRSGRLRELLILACLLSGASLAGLVTVGGGWWVWLWMALYGFGRAPILPYLEATALEQSERRRFDYGPVRLWGSLSFAVASVVVGVMGDRGGLDGVLLSAAGLLVLAGLVSAVGFPRSAVDAGSGAGDDRPESAAGWGRLIVCCALMQLSHGAYYTFYSIHVEELGYGRQAIGLLWAVAIVCEVALFTRLDAVVARYGTRTVLIGCLGVAVLRWLMIGLSASPIVLVLAQCLHAATYAGFHVAAIREVYRRFGPGRRARGQALYSGMTYGLGMFLGSVIAGLGAGSVGLPGLFLASAAVAALAVPLAAAIGARTRVG